MVNALMTLVCEASNGGLTDPGLSGVIISGEPIHRSESMGDVRAVRIFDGRAKVSLPGRGRLGTSVA
jgi:hypothetical protein